MAKVINTNNKLETSKVSRPGIHSKTKQSSLKTSKNYFKTNRGQGRV